MAAGRILVIVAESTDLTTELHAERRCGDRRGDRGMSYVDIPIEGCPGAVGVGDGRGVTAAVLVRMRSGHFESAAGVGGDRAARRLPVSPGDDRRIITHSTVRIGIRKSGHSGVERVARRGVDSRNIRYSKGGV